MNLAMKICRPSLSLAGKNLENQNQKEVQMRKIQIIVLIAGLLLLLTACAENEQTPKVMTINKLEKIMSDQNYTTAFLVDQTPEEVFAAINNVRGWWSENIEGETDELGSVFYYEFKDIHRGTFKITEFVPGKKVVWHVLQNYFNFVKDMTEWTGTDIVFEIAKKGDKTELRFTHVGLKPSEECTTCVQMHGVHTLNIVCSTHHERQRGSTLKSE
jgi:hypothetical protein